MKDLILRIRSEMLKTNITRIRDKVARLSKLDRYTNIETLSKTAADLLSELDATLSEMNRLRRRNPLSVPQPLAENVQLAFEQVNKLSDCHSKMMAQLESLRNSARREIPARQDAGRAPEACIKHLSSIAEALDKINPDRTLAWSAYQQKYDEVHRLFSEYLEFMSGFALRDAGLDEGMCDLAEELIQTYRFQDRNYEFLSIPGRQEAVRMTWARVIRMGFPEWTLWALPLTAHDIWFELAREDLDARKMLGQIPVDLAHVQECLSEAFALWLTGPAYAYAAFFLRLDPFTAYQTGNGHATDGARAYSIFKMWNLMDEADPNNLLYSPFIKDLQDEWDESIKFAKPQGNLEPQIQGTLDQAIPALYESLYQKTLGGYNTTSWARIQPWPDQILQNKDVNITGAEYRDVLNAVWLARIKEPAQYLNIEKKGFELWNKIRDARAQSTLPSVNLSQSRPVGGR